MPEASDKNRGHNSNRHRLFATAMAVNGAFGVASSTRAAVGSMSNGEYLKSSFQFGIASLNFLQFIQTSRSSLSGWTKCN